MTNLQALKLQEIFSFALAIKVQYIGIFLTKCCSSLIQGNYVKLLNQKLLKNLKESSPFLSRKDCDDKNVCLPKNVFLFQNLLVITSFTLINDLDKLIRSKISAG